MKRTALTTLTLLVTLAIGFGWGVLTERRHNHGYEYVEVEKAISSQYVEPVDRDKLLRGCYEGMLNSLGDAYSHYYTVDELARESEDDRKEKIGDVLKIDYVSERGRTYAVIGLSTFSPVVENEFVATISETVNYSPDGVILDLRGNLGGIVSAAQVVAGAWIGEMAMAKLDNHRGDVELRYGIGKPILGSMPVAVLVDGYTASSAEIVAGALRDQVRAPLIGSKTYGKGLVQGLVSLPNGAWVKITTHWWHTPSGHSVAPDGLMPDVLVQDKSLSSATGTTVDLSVKAAIERLSQ